LNTLYLFTNKFPFYGGESFLETEIHYLSKAFEKVIIYPASGFDSELLPLPDNVEVGEFQLNQPVYLRKLLIKQWWIFLKWFLIEIIKSPHKAKYFSQFKWNFKRLAGLVNNAALFKTQNSPLKTQYSTPIGSTTGHPFLPLQIKWV
jgi:hypothetical protein